MQKAQWQSRAGTGACPPKNSEGSGSHEPPGPQLPPPHLMSFALLLLIVWMTKSQAATATLFWLLSPATVFKGIARNRGLPGWPSLPMPPPLPGPGAAVLLFNLLRSTKSPLVCQIFKLLRALLVMVGPVSPGWGGFYVCVVCLGI